MDALLETSEQLSFIFNWITGIGLGVQFVFMFLILVHTPKEMTSFKYTLSNALFWSFLICIHIGIFIRPVTFLPLPICLITGPAKYLGDFFGGKLHVVVIVLLLINKSTAYMLCLSGHFFAFKFPMFVRRLRLKEGAMIFVFVHFSISGVLVVTAYLSGLLTLSDPMLTQKQMKDQIHFYSPAKYKSLRPLIDSSLLIGVPRASIRCIYTFTYLVISVGIFVINATLMIYAVTMLWRSIQEDKTESTRRYKKRLMILVLTRTLVPTFTFSLPAFFIIYTIELDKEDTTAFVIQTCLLLILFSPAFCCVTTMLGLKPYRKAICGLFQLKFSRFIEKHSESEQTTETNSKRSSIRNNRVSNAYTSNLSNSEDVRNNRI